MSKREKTIVLYSRNGIKIDKTDFLDMTKWSNLKDNNVFVFNELLFNLSHNTAQNAKIGIFIVFLQSATGNIYEFRF